MIDTIIIICIGAVALAWIACIVAFARYIFLEYMRIIRECVE